MAFLVSKQPVVLFDGVCNLCNGSVLFIIKRDRPARFRFAALQSEAAAAALKTIDPSLNVGGLPDSMVLIEDGRLFTRSTAALRVARGLRFPWPLMYGFIIVPPFLRNWMYDIIARHRYRWFGRRETCMIPTPELAARFLSG